MPTYCQSPDCVTYSQTNPPSTEKWYKSCEKKVIKPLQKNAKKNQYGCIEYEESIHTSNGIIKNRVVLTYISKVAHCSQEPYVSMRVNNDTTYYFTNDSLYIFDKTGNLVCVKYYLKERWDYFASNPFLSYYAFYTFFSGGCTYIPYYYKKSGHVLIADFTSPIFDDGEKKTLRDPYHPGRHHYVLDMKKHSLIQYVYEPCPMLYDQLGYTKKTYQLFHHTTTLLHIDYPIIIKQRNKNY